MLLKPRELLASQMFKTILTSVGIYGLSLVTGPLLAHSLGPSGRGELTSVQVPSQLFGYLLCFGLPNAALYYARSHQRAMSITISWIFALAIGAVVIASVWVFIPSYLHGKSPETMFWLRVMLITTIGYVPISVTISLMRVNLEDLNSYNAMTAFPLVFYTILIVGFAAAGRLDLHTSYWILFVSQLSWYAVVIVRFSAWPRFHVNRQVMKAEVSYGSRLAIGSFAGIILNRLDQFVLISFVSSRELGLYAVAAMASGLSGPAAMAIGNVLFPRLRRAGASGAQSWEVTKQTMWRGFFLSLTIAGIVAAASPLALPLLFGKRFSGSLVPIWLLLPGQVASDVGNIAASKTMSDNRPGSISMAYVAAAIATIIGLAIAIGPFQINGAAVVTSISEFVSFAFLFAGARKQRDEHPIEVPDPVS